MCSIVAPFGSAVAHLGWALGPAARPERPAGLRASLSALGSSTGEGVDARDLEKITALMGKEWG